MATTTEQQRARIESGSILVWLALCLGFITWIAGGLSFFDLAFEPNAPRDYLLIYLAVGIGVVGLARSRAKLSMGDSGTLFITAAGIALLVLSTTTWFSRPYTLFAGPVVRAELLVAFLLALFVGTSYRIIVGWFAVAAVVLATREFFVVSGGNPLFSDDHPTFMYRLWLLKEHFPHIPFYLPLWNGGLDMRDFFATGSLNFFFISLPILLLGPVISVYNLAVAFVLFGIVPAIAALSARLLGASRSGVAIAALLAISSSLNWYNWALHLGTMGFIVSTALMPLVLVLLARVAMPSTLSDGAPSWKLLTLVAVVTTLALLWPPVGPALIPAFLVVACALPRLLKHRHVWLVGLLFIGVNVSWMGTLWTVSKVGSLLTAESTSKSAKTPAPVATPTESSLEVPEGTDSAQIENTSTQQVPNATAKTAVQPAAETASSNRDTPRFRKRSGKPNFAFAFKLFGEHASQANPLVLLFLIPALLLVPSGYRLVLGGTALWMAGIALIVSPVKPQLELDRFLLMAFTTSVPAVAFLLSSFLDSPRATFLGKVAHAVLLAFLFVSPFMVTQQLRNRTLYHYSFAQPEVNELAAALSANKSGARALFTGCVIHELSSGHLAPLALMTGRPLIASSHVHNLWWYTQVFPREFIHGGDEGIRRYLDLYNVSTVIAHEKRWNLYFSSRPDEYKLVQKVKAQSAIFSIFERQHPTNTFFLEGAGTITEQTTNAVRLSLSSPSAVIKFNYFPFLEAKGCTISPAPQSESVTFVRLSDCPIGESIELKHGPLLRRLFPKGA